MCIYIYALTYLLIACMGTKYYAWTNWFRWRWLLGRRLHREHQSSEARHISEFFKPACVGSVHVHACMHVYVYVSVYVCVYAYVYVYVYMNMHVYVCICYLYIYVHI